MDKTYCRGCGAEDVEIAATLILSARNVPDAKVCKGDFCAGCLKMGGFRCAECGKPLVTQSNLVVDPSEMTYADITTKMISVKVTAPDGFTRDLDFCCEEHLRSFFKATDIPDDAWEVIDYEGES